MQIITFQDYYTEPDGVTQEDIDEFEELDVFVIAKWFGGSYTAHVVHNSIEGLYQALDEVADPCCLVAVWGVLNTGNDYVDTDDEPRLNGEVLRSLMEHQALKRAAHLDEWDQKEKETKRLGESNKNKKHFFEE